MQSQHFKLTSEYIELFKLLQVSGLASSGGEAKQMISQETVLVNNVTETRKRKKLRIGDEVCCEHTRIEICADG